MSCPTGVNGELPGARALMDGILACGRWAVSDLGIYNCRKIAGSNAWSKHALSEALDLGVAVIDGRYDKATGDALADFLIDHWSDLGVTFIVWWHRDWAPVGGWTPYGGSDPHENHLHVEINPHAARHLTRDYVDSILRVEEDDMPYTEEQLRKIVREECREAQKIFWGELDRETGKFYPRKTKDRLLRWLQRKGA